MSATVMNRPVGMTSRLLSWLPEPVLSPRAAYMMRTLASILIALYLGFKLQLTSPGTASITVMILASPVRGAIISKGAWRIFGTVTGGAAGVVIMSAFPQSTFLFLLGVAFWLGLCTFLASMFRYSRSYGAVLSGFTVTLVVFGALRDPNSILILALNRVGAVTLGVVVSSAVTMIFQAATTRTALRARLLGGLASIAALVRDSGTLAPIPLRQAREKLIAELQQLDEVIEYSGVEAPDTQRHANSLRGALIAMSGAPFAVLRVGTIMQELSANPLALPPAVGRTVVELRALIARLADARSLGPAALNALSMEVSAVTAHLRQIEAETEDVVLAGQIARLHGFLGRMEEAVAPIAAWEMNAAPYHAHLNLDLFRDYRTATRNGMRAAIALMLGGTFWYVTAWPAGSLLLLILGPVCGLLSTAPSAAAASVEFAKGIALASVAGFLCLSLLLPPVTGFAMLAVVLLMFLIPALYFTTVPRYGLFALGFVIFFLTQIALTNVATFNVAAFINNAMGYNLGAIAGVFVFRILLAPNPAQDACQLARLIRCAIEQAARRPGEMLWLEWQNLQNQRFMRLLMRLQTFPEQRLAAIEAGGPLLILSRDIFRLHIMLRGTALPSHCNAAVARALRSLGRLGPGSRAAAQAAETANHLEHAFETTEPPLPVLLQAAAAFRAIARMLPEAEPVLSLNRGMLRRK
jgi:uncharacterized membrane protein YccC